LGVKATMLVADYSSEGHYFEFDPDTGDYSRIKLPERRKDRAGYSGVAQLLNSPKEGKVLVAKYLWSEDAWFSIGAEKWRLFDQSLVLRHTDTLFRCEFSIHRDGKRIRKFRYRRRDWFALMIDPTYDYLDFDLANLPVSLVPSEGDSLQKQRETFIKWLTPDSTPKTATIRLTRRRDGWDRGRYPVLINGIEHGRIGRGDVFECQIPSGKVSLRLGYYYWPGSNTLEFNADENSSTHLECGSNLRGWKIFRIARRHQATNEYVWLKFAAPGGVDVIEGTTQRDAG
jgi:hypothetical protein